MGEKISFYSLDRSARMREPGKFYLPGEGSHSYTFHFTSWRKIRELQVEFGSSEGNYKVDLRLLDKELFKGHTTNEIKKLKYTSPPSYRYKHVNLYSITLDLEEASGIQTAKPGFVLSILPSY